MLNIFRPLCLNLDQVVAKAQICDFYTAAPGFNMSFKPPSSLVLCDTLSSIRPRLETLLTQCHHHGRA